jgi:hypothetical protein
MASTRKSVSFPGVLTGQGLQATCTVSAVEVTLGGTGESAYTDHSIGNVSKLLPDGDYELLANGEKSQIRLKDGSWLSAA